MITYLCKVSVISVSLESKFKSIETLATAGQYLILEIVFPLVMVIKLNAHISDKELSLFVGTRFSGTISVHWRRVTSFLNGQFSL